MASLPPVYKHPCTHSFILNNILFFLFRFCFKNTHLHLHEAHESQPGTSRRGRSVPPARKKILKSQYKSSWASSRCTPAPTTKF